MGTTDIEASHWAVLQSCASYLKLLLMQPNNSTLLGTNFPTSLISSIQCFSCLFNLLRSLLFAEFIPLFISQHYIPCFTLLPLALFKNRLWYHALEPQNFYIVYTSLAVLTKHAHTHTDVLSFACCVTAVCS